MRKERLYGVVIPTITPMNEDGSIDEQSLKDYTEYLIKTGVNCLYPNGTNGESLLLSKEEREQVASVMVETNNHRLPIFIQCGSMTTEETISHGKHAVEIGADGIGVMSPAFFPMDDQSLLEYYSAIIESLPSDYPVYLYNIPGCTANDVKPEVLNQLMAKYDNLVGIKYSNSDLIRVENYLECPKRKPDLLIGCDSLFLQCLTSGGVGTVTGPGAIFHKKFNRLYQQFSHGDLEGAIKTQQEIVKIDRQLEGIPGIPALKAMLKMRGVIKNDTCRAPLRKLTSVEYKTVEAVLEAYDREEN
ncbi:dihydrodipicolinate synthase family protein [Ohessyouella blattaphilus]|uniref:Dihydrodipicolinate synthase family protein n=1 Tax=Ohessyouella blattaphilus TaxID=2949333 RepID=A0ABT1EKV7_9FIRM|nr:dihydrodipicolinate synthase family protein [Ohessyouella blattaphilus]MCP1111156.1 dihydrodipicolinate synthase family protein [Ohessyouella blattaphilus]MCR8564550.1 dihydrodipicolinate synthase family protein [Ohessyouella blattaphilus]